jgi:hypothetical protein
MIFPFLGGILKTSPKLRKTIVKELSLSEGFASATVLYFRTFVEKLIDITSVILLKFQKKLIAPVS